AYMSYTIIVLCIMSLGIQKGIERTCLTFVPVLVGLLLFIVYWSCKLEGFTQAINFLFSFQSTHISTRSILEAAGHALFSLATGAGTALVYGSHLPNKVSLGKATLAIAVTNIFVALIAGLAIFPAVFTFDYSPNMGPELMYKVLPLAFQHLPYGYFFTCIFFVILLIAAITSSVSILEPLVGAASERFTTNRKKSCLFIFAATFVPSTALILSFNVYQDVTFFEQSPFQWIADSLVSVLLCLGTLLFTLFAAWKIPEQDFFIAFGNHKGDSSPGFFTLTARLWLKYFLPVILSALLILSFF
ncbi:MAG: sodium-dependent transporter, partial [Zetaproteobacteria bacterium]|nr:sodium-dependent transporter [Zetaproteobacteria bacterium]